MKKKKLNLMELGSILDRSEMKKIMAGSGTCSCATDECGVSFGQFSWGWDM